MSKQWFVATTKHNGEMLAARMLREQKFGVYLPKAFEQQKDGRRVHPTARLRFSGYIFVAFDLALEQHGPIGNTRGVGELLLDPSGKPEALYPGIIERLRALEDVEFEQCRNSAELKERTDLAPGDEVTVDDKDHLAHGQRGFYMGQDGKSMANVLIGMAVWKVNSFGLRKIEKPKKAEPVEKPKKGKRR
jgi:transcription antitermination factor NusG